MSECRVCEERGTPREGNHPQTLCHCERFAATVERFGVVTGDDVKNKPEDDEGEVDEIHHEGKTKYRVHRTRERDPNLRKRKIAEVTGKLGKPVCEACEVEIESVYCTPHGSVYECHHLTPLHVTGETETVLSDIVLLCPTCHRAAHRTKPWPTLEQMRALHTP